MRNVWIICKKELSSYFVSPVAYVLLAMYSLIFGLFFWLFLQRFVVVGIEMQMRGQSLPMNVNEELIRPLLSNMAVVGLLFIPMITMRLFAEEKRTGTIELLVTSPVRDLEIIIGKWLAALLLFCSLLFMSVLDMTFIFRYGKPDLKPLLIGYLGLLLQGGCLLAIGTFISTCTKNQIVAGVAGFSVCLLLWVLDWMSSFQDSVSAKVVAYLSVLQHFDSFSKGVLDSKDIIYYVS